MTSDDRGERQPPRRDEFANRDRDGETVRLLRTRKDEGLSRLLADHGAVVRDALVRDLFVPPDRVEDAMITALHRVWESIGRYDPAKGTLRAWYFVIARNTLRSAEKRERRQRPGTTLELIDSLFVDERPELLEEPVASGLVRTLQTCIPKLPPLQRAVIEADLRSGGTVTGEELAAELKSTVNAVYAARSKAMRSLKQWIEEERGTAS